MLGVRPEHIALGEAARAMPFSADAGVELVEPMGSDTLVWTKLGGQGFAFRVEAERHLASGDQLRIGFDPARASLFDGQSGNRI